MLYQSQLDSIKESLENGDDESSIISRETEKYLEDHCRIVDFFVETREGSTKVGRGYSEQDQTEAEEFVTEAVEKIKRELGL